MDLFDGNQSILDLLLQRGAYSTPGVPRTTLPPSVPPPSVPYPVSGGGTLPLYPSPATSPSLSVPSLTPGSTAEVLVVEVSAVNNLYVQLAAALPQLQNMVTQMGETLSVSGQPLPAASLRVGALCAVHKVSGGGGGGRKMSCLV